MNVFQHTKNTTTPRLVKTALHSSKILSFPTLIKAKQCAPGWVCNVSQYFSFVEIKQDRLQIKPSEVYSQFELLSKLLEANTCRVIYFDAQFNASQLRRLRMLQSQSRTELFNAKMAHLFSAKVISMHS